MRFWPTTDLGIDSSVTGRRACFTCLIAFFNCAVLLSGMPVQPPSRHFLCCIFPSCFSFQNNIFNTFQTTSCVAHIDGNAIKCSGPWGGIKWSDIARTAKVQPLQPTAPLVHFEQGTASHDSYN
ncbi:hypothetical protein BJV78DRAFT_549136 [Lactifluus subvellereus]|nr:hypothetical protein BJV78DRAFT_549136 [Lactifluus subvellereus]